MRKVVILAVLFPLNLYSQSCGSVAEGTEVRLDTETGPLKNSRSQDQDGLGTCYANTASIMLQSALPDSPDVSYINLAIGYGEKYNSRKTNSSAYSSNGNMLINGGTVCEAIDVAKENGGVCNRKDVPLESVLFDNNLETYNDHYELQKEVLNRVSQYYDGVNKQFTLQQNNPALSNATEIITQLTDEGAKSETNIFSREKFEKLKLSNNLSKKEKYQLALYDLFQKKAPEYSAKNCEKLEAKNALTLARELAAHIYNRSKSGKLDPASYLLQMKISRPYSIRNPGLNETYEFNVSSDFKKMIEKVYLKSLTSSPAPKSGKEAMALGIKELLPSRVTDKQVLDILNQLDSQTLDLLEDDYNRYAKKDFSKCSSDKLAYLRNQDGMMKDFASHPCLSSYQKLGEGIQNLVSSFDNSNISDFEKIADFVLNSPDNNYEKALNQLLAPTCSDNQKIKIPANLSCKENKISFLYTNTDNPVELEKKMVQEREKLLNTAKESFNNGFAFGANLCSIFFKEDPNYFFNSLQPCRASRGNSYHVVSVIGYRCKAGKIDYLIQNSWGEWRDLEDKKYQREGKTGKAWFDEDSLIKNTTSYSTLKK